MMMTRGLPEILRRGNVKRRRGPVKWRSNGFSRDVVEIFRKDRPRQNLS